MSTETMTEPVVTSAAGLGTVSGVEVFRTGTYRDIEFTQQDLTTIVDNFARVRKLGWDVPVVLDHEEGEEPDFSAVGLTGRASVGWVRNMRVEGNSVFCDFVDVHPKVVELINKRSYKKVSISLVKYFKDATSGEEFELLPSHVALLGALWPEVGGMADVPQATVQHKAMAFTKKGLTIATYTIGGKTMPEKKAVKMQDDGGVPQEEPAPISIEELNKLISELKETIILQAQKIEELEAAVGGGATGETTEEGAATMAAESKKKVEPSKDREPELSSEVKAKFLALQARAEKSEKTTAMLLGKDRVRTVEHMLSTAVQDGRLTPGMIEEKEDEPSVQKFLHGLGDEQLVEFDNWLQKFPKIVSMVDTVGAGDETAPATGGKFKYTSTESEEEMKKIEAFAVKQKLDPSKPEELKKAIHLFYVQNKK